jgi:lipopolysaccharide biosynthesis regulator YciM
MAAHYVTKNKIKKDKIGVGVILQLLGIAIAIFTFATIVGPIIGLAMLIGGGVMAREKRYLCQGCGNEMAKEARVCPVCKATYDE